MELDEYVDWVHRNVDGFDEASVEASAPQLRALANNRELVLDMVEASLKQDDSFLQAEGVNQYTDSAFILYNSAQEANNRKGRDRFLQFAVRAVVWRVPRLWTNSPERENVIHSYELPHDHNFTFITAGYLGPGYKTRIYEYDYDKVKGYAGESVDIRFLEETYLPQFKLMMYRKNKDIHIQHSPEALSISLNLIISGGREDVANMTQQYHFDLEKKCILERALGPASNGMALLDLAAEIGDENTADIVARIAHSDPHPETREMAYRALARLAPSERERIQTAINEDPSPIVRSAKV
jgi:hypothetical protein